MSGSGSHTGLTQSQAGGDSTLHKPNHQTTVGTASGHNYWYLPASGGGPNRRNRHPGKKCVVKSLPRKSDTMSRSRDSFTRTSEACLQHKGLVRQVGGFTDCLFSQLKVEQMESIILLRG